MLLQFLIGYLPYLLFNQTIFLDQSLDLLPYLLFLRQMLPIKNLPFLKDPSNLLHHLIHNLVINLVNIVLRSFHLLNMLIHRSLVNTHSDLLIHPIFHILI